MRPPPTVDEQALPVGRQCDAVGVMEIARRLVDLAVGVICRTRPTIGPASRGGV